ncbi:uncharacterized protein PODANS_4_7140 [Podospora anserina S mat+]|uniref:Podospora anserina S mat+ genomic DNA chromosome 4, supercontig 4 n=1 Tax=Podospora anserina (strain S / ATCC MYA-4624 / DSM 980 / FGSC 10383) TaxID=515849 RepID=B2ARK8_PODAN|nr:uncharacterized protein PODANS_4_7140 [Podospora anserina S mat+]CAP66786.1 unnamed protein product [Podospora anserina S mat+]CDP28524.1 Putative protein of unknown function [Podospora anserina S mat+]
MESEPLCHRVAARLLVNNCELVDGKNEATMLTDSGRQLRDFVDSYAASLAICDLERGSFKIPNECAKFREPSLTQIAMRSEPQLHVTPSEIGLCLSALAASDAAWSTWVSYRHKALRFCEAARADNEKAELQKRMDDLDNRARQSMENLDRLAPKVDELGEGLSRLESYLSGDLDFAMRKATESMQDSLENAEGLQKLLGLLFANVLDGSSRAAHAHETSLQQTKRVNDGMGALIDIVSTAMASSASLTVALAQRQDALEQGVDRILAATEKLSDEVEDHTSMLKQAKNITNEILDALEETAAAALTVNESMFKTATTKSWWPFLVCPSASLVLGSYGMPPSMLRNFGLLAFGEAIGFLVSSYGDLTTQFSITVDAFGDYVMPSELASKFDANNTDSTDLTNLTDTATEASSL